MGRHEDRMIRAEAAANVAEAVAIVSGRLLVDRWGDRPELGWMALNTLAHGDRALLRQIADGPALERGQTWDGAVRYLAGAGGGGVPSEITSPRRRVTCAAR